MKSFIAFATIILVIGFTEAKRCPQFCPMIFAPVCGSDGVENLVFSNKCMMTVFACNESRDFKVVSLRECPESQLPKVFGSLSAYLPASVPVPLPLKLKKSPKECGPCTRIYAPVCGSDGVEVRKFSNQCMMEFENCMESRSFHVLKNVRDC